MSAVATFDRRGACPSLSAPMQTGDGLLVRLNPVAGSLTPAQLAGLCNAAERHGNGLVEITSRGSFQIRGLTDQSAADLADAVDALGIDVRTGVPVETSPLAGLDPEEIADPLPLANKIRARIAEQGLVAQLGPKVSVVVDGGGVLNLDTVPADVRLTATGIGKWRVALAGASDNPDEIVLLSEVDAVEQCLACLHDIAERGLQARASDLAGTPVAWQPAARKRPIKKAPRFTHALNDGRIVFVIALPFGSATAPELRSYAETAGLLGVSDLRFAPGRMLLALCEVATVADALKAKATTLGFVVDSEDRRAFISACVGKPACASGRIATRQIAEWVATTHTGLLHSAGKLHISGCEKGCAHPAASRLTLVGRSGGIGLVVNGTARDMPVANAAADESGLMQLIDEAESLLRETPGGPEHRATERLRERAG